MVAVLGIRVIVHGKFPNPETGACILVAPHVNLFDPVILGSVLPRAIAGVELDRHFEWPLYGRIIRRLGHIAISHANPHRTRSSLLAVEERLRTGAPLIVFPEGHRTRTGSRGPFGSWIFRVAARTGTPVIPIAFHGAWERHHVGSWILSPGVWEVRVLGPIQPGGDGREAAETLKAEVERAIDEAFVGRS
jgi:1-acyl-sn-glycerol-3-phosphate acyltransferase